MDWRLGDTVIAFIQLSWIHDQGLRNDAWIVFYYDCITVMVLVEARMYCLMYIIIYMLLSVFLMASENPGVDNPCGVSKAFLSTAFGLRPSLDYCFVWFDIIIRLCRTNCRTLVD
uniref:Uncharacterized protein n=2 Tax=Opuntia streptacantha TaxID=393608 RepID=A0A7C9CZJ1_OPUST